MRFGGGVEALLGDDEGGADAEGGGDGQREADVFVFYHLVEVVERGCEMSGFCGWVFGFCGRRGYRGIMVWVVFTLYALCARVCAV